MEKPNSKLTSNSRATTMAELLQKAKSTFVNVKKGEAVKGIITKLTPSEILIDINAKTEAVVLEKDKSILNKILSRFKVGDEVSVTILNPESDTGNSVVSLRRSIENIVWEKLSSLQKKQEVLEAVVDSATKGGFLVTSPDGASGFLPNSHISTLDNPQSLIGKKIKVIVLELNRQLHKIIFSQKQALGLRDFEELVKRIRVGQKIEADVSNVTSFGLFLSIPVDNQKLAEGFIHISEASWENVDDISKMFKVGDKITGIVLGFDSESRRVNLSMKRLKADPFEKKLEEFTIDKKLKGRVSKIISSGVLLDLGDNIVGIIKKEKVPIKTSYKEGLEIEVVVSEIDKKRHRVEVTPVLLEKPIGYR